MKTPVLLATALLGVALPGSAAAVDPFEIQVYDGSSNAPGEFGLELHTNYTFAGRTEPEFPSEITPHHVARFTLEPSLGVTKWLELGAYLQGLVGPEGAAFGGVKLRTKFVVPAAATEPFRFGVNLEVSSVPERIDVARWANEIRPILAYSGPVALVAFNPIIDTALSGSDRWVSAFEPALKVALNTQLGFALGAEYYAGFGPFRELLPLGRAQQLLFAAFDLVPASDQPASGFELNAAFGHSLTSATDQEWIAKAIFGIGL